MDDFPVFALMLQVVACYRERFTYEQVNSLKRMLSCRTIDMGGRIVYCPTCKTYSVLYNPCNRRGCPICYEKNQIAWRNKLEKKLLPLGHYHLIFSIPDEITTIWMIDKKLVCDTLFYAIQRAFKKLYEKTGILLGIIMVFQSHGRGLSYKPHMHCIVTPGGLLNNKKWVPIVSLPYKELSQTVQQEFQQHMEKQLKKEKRAILNKIFTNTVEKDWKVHPVFHRFSGASIVRYLSHTICGVVIDMNQDFQINRRIHTIGFKEYHRQKEVWTTLPSLTFTERYLNHIPPNHAVTIRNYGLYSNRYTEELEQVREELSPSEKAEEPETEANDAADRCAVCDTLLIIKESFLPGEIPKILIKSLFGTSRDPPYHGECIMVQE